MPEPYNYSLNIKQPDLAADFARGMQLGEMSRQNEFEMQQKQQAVALAQQKQDRLAAAMARLRENKTTSGVLSVMAENPELSAGLEPYMKALKEGERDTLIGHATDIKMALASGKRDIAMDLIKKFRDAARNSGRNDWADQADMRYKLIESAETGKVGDDIVEMTADIFLAKALGPEKYAEAFERFDKQAIARDKAPSEIMESEAKASTARTQAAVAAKYLDQETAARLAETGVRTQAILDDTELKRQKNKIDLMQAQTSRMESGLKREQMLLNLEKERRDLGEKALAKTAEAKSVFDGIDTILSTSQEALNKGDQKTLGVSTGTAGTGPLIGRIGSLDSTVVNFREAVNTLKSQVFLVKAKDMKGLGSLTEAEGAKLERSIRSLDLTQSWKQLRYNISEIQRLMAKARERTAEKYGFNPERDVAPSAQAPRIKVDF